MRRCRTACAGIALLASAAAVPSTPRRALQEVNFTPTGTPKAPDGRPECEMMDSPYGRTEDMADTFQGLGTCDHMIASGRYTCAHSFCPECNYNAYCDKTCNFCESTADEIVDCDPQTNPDCGDGAAHDPNCQDDEAARAAADPFHNPLEPWTQGCDELAESSFCDEPTSVGLGIQTFCCASCQALGDGHATACDFMAIVNACQNPDDMSNAQDLTTICASPCSVAVVANYAACMKDPAADMAPFAGSLGPIVEGCSQLAGTAVNVFGDLQPGRFCGTSPTGAACFVVGEPSNAGENIVSCADAAAAHPYGHPNLCPLTEIIGANGVTWTLPQAMAEICPVECGGMEVNTGGKTPGGGH